MVRRTVRTLAAVALVVASGVVGLAPSAGAQQASSLDDYGWWSRANQGAPLNSVISADVSEGQLLVEATPEGATAIAALRATLPEGSTSPVLTLTVASDVGGDSADVLACQAGSGWTGAHGGEWGSKPSPDCAQSVQGIPSEDGSSWSFALAPLQFGDQLNVVLAPGAGSSFRVVFEQPSAASIEVSSSSVEPDVEIPEVAPAQPAEESPPPPAASSPPPTAAPTPSRSSFSSPTFTAPARPTADDLATQPAQAALPADEQGLTATAPILTSAAPAPLPTPELPDPNTREGQLFGVAVALAALGLLYWSTTQEVPERRVLSRFATNASLATAGAAPPATEPTDAVVPEVRAEDAQMGGLGRFRRVRTTPARRLGM